jgi:hypothetical protein
VLTGSDNADADFVGCAPSADGRAALGSLGFDPRRS